VLGGVIYFLAFCGFGIWPLTFVAQIPLVAALELSLEARTRRVLALGMLHGYVQSAGGYYWLVDMLENFSGYHGAPNVFFASVFFLYQAGQMAVLAWLYVRARRRDLGVVPSAVAATAAVELAYPLLFPSYLGSGLNAVPTVMQIADIGGPILLSALASWVSASLYELVAHAVRKEPLPRRELAAAAVALLSTIAYGHYRIAEVEGRMAEADHLRVGLVQTNMGLFDKREDPREGQRRNIDQSLELEQTVSPDLLVWSESAFNYLVPDTVTNLRHLVMTDRGRGQLHTPILFGGISQRRLTDGSRQLFNTAFLIDAEGRVLGTYDKTYLLAFGEYLPFGDVFPELYELSPNSGHFTPGNHRHPLVLGEHRISTLICYEDVLPHFTRRAVAEANPHLLVNITNDAWFGDTQEPWVHLALAQFRSVEHHRAMVRATNSGVTAIVDPLGRVVHHGDTFVRENVAGEVAMLDGWTPYQSLGDFPGWIAVLLLVWREARVRFRSYSAEGKRSS